MNVYNIKVGNQFISVEDGAVHIYKDKALTTLHCEDGPAIIHPDGYCAYYVNGSVHREDGPARILADGSEMYALNGKIYEKEDYEREMNLRNARKIKINKVDKDQTLLYHDKLGFVGEVDIYQFYDVRKQIREANVSGFYFIYENKHGLTLRVDVNPDGSISNSPTDFMTILSDLLDEMIF